MPVSPDQLVICRVSWDTPLDPDITEPTLIHPLSAEIYVNNVLHTSIFPISIPESEAVGKTSPSDQEGFVYRESANIQLLKNNAYHLDIRFKAISLIYPRESRSSAVDFYILTDGTISVKYAGGWIVQS